MSCLSSTERVPHLRRRCARRCPPLPRPSAPPRLSHRNRTHAPGVRPASRELEKCSSAASVAASVSSCSWSLPPARRSTRRRRAGRAPCAAHWRGRGRRAARHQRRGAPALSNKVTPRLGRSQPWERHHPPARRGDAVAARGRVGIRQPLRGGARWRFRGIVGILVGDRGCLRTGRVRRWPHRTGRLRP